MENKVDLKIAKEVLRLRFSQLIVNEKYKAGLFKIPIHLAIGHEAIAVAVSSIMEKNDKLVCSHRNIHYNLARAGALKPILDEYLLKKEGLAGAKLGSMNLANDKAGIVYTSSILGNNLPVATGLALAQKAKGSRSLVIVQTGDGAIEEGSFYESLLFLSSNALSALVIVENNGWSMHTKVEERRSPIDLTKFAAALGVGYEKFSANNVYDYSKHLKEIRERLLNDKTSLVLEVDLTTLGGWHVEEGDKKEKRFIHPHAGPLSKTEIAVSPVLEHTANDPVFVLEQYLSADELKTMSGEILENIKKELGE